MDEILLKDKLLIKLTQEKVVESKFVIELFNNNEPQIKKIVNEFEKRRLVNVTRVDQGIGFSTLLKLDFVDTFFLEGGFKREKEIKEIREKIIEKKEKEESTIRKLDIPNKRFDLIRNLWWMILLIFVLLMFFLK